MLLANQNPGYTRQNIADWCLNFELEIFTKAPEKVSRPTFAVPLIHTRFR